MIRSARSEDSRDSSTTDEGPSSLEDLIEECTNRLQAGEELNVEELAAGHPEHADRLRRLFPSLRMMAEAGRTASGIPPAPLAGPGPLGPPAPGPLDLGDYRILRPIGRGGMGIVYEAMQLSLNRRVALKVLPFAAALDPHQLRRFQIEAQAAAQLHHTSIVPVFSVGCEHGVHFYAMQYIEGRTLAALIQERREAPRPDSGPTRRPADREYIRSVARLGIQAAEALDHAHRQGIIHRDIKPANLLVDDRGGLWITDFGLARFVNEAGLTVTGDLIGTLRYMSPEQALAKRLILDHRTDIYSLGATLYELLTLRPAVDGSDRQEVLHRIAQHAPVPPRRIDPAIPRDVETILLKSLAREPEERYATAQELADDLRRFLEHRPITARRPGVVERAMKWLRRHPAMVGSAVLVLVVAMIGLAASLIVVNRERSRTAERAGEARRLARTLEWELYISRVSQAHGDYQAGNLTRADATLAACPEPLRNWEWRFVRGLCHQECYSVPACARPDGVDRLPILFTHDGACWISGVGSTNILDRPGELKLWDVATGRLVRDLAPDGLPSIMTLALSPDGRTLAVGFVDAATTAQLRDAATGHVVGELAAPRAWGQPRGLAFSPDGRLLADVRESGRLVVWDIAERRRIGDVAAHEGYRFAVAFHPAGDRIATAGEEGVIRLWDPKSVRPIHALHGHDGRVFDLAFSPDRLHLASAGWDQTVRIWALDQSSRMLIPARDGFVTRVAYSPSGDRIAVSSDQSVTIREARTGRELQTLRGQDHLGTGLAFAPSGDRLLISGLDGKVRLWEPARAAPRILHARGWVNHVAFGADGNRLIAADAGGRITTWEVATGRILQVFQGHDDAVRSAWFTPDGTGILSASWDASVRIWDAGGRSRWIVGDPLSAPGHRRMGDRGTSINDLAMSPDGSIAAAAGWDRTVRVVDVASGAERACYSGHRSVVWSVAFSPDGGRIASAGADGTVRVWDARDGRDIWTVPAGVSRVATTQRRILAFSPDGRWLAVCLGHGPRDAFRVQTWDAATGAPVRTLTDPAGQINAVTFSPDGTRIATAGENRTVTLWDAATGESVLTLRGHTAAVLSVAFSLDGRRLASGSIDATVRIWDAP